MSNAINLINDNIQSSRPILSRYRLESEIYDVNKEIQSRIQEQAPQIMLFGAYNAGKSTLINTLLGVEKANVDDIPTTDSVDSYNWDGFRLIDTPGVNAPIEHEETTAEQIKRTSVMLFVIREGDLDSKDLYQRLFELLNQNKHIFIVLNHQLTNLEDKANAHRKIIQILSELSVSYGVSLDDVSKIHVYPMNVKSALKGRLSKNEKLIEHSGYYDFIKAFRTWLSDYDSEINFLDDVKSLVKHLWYEPVVALLEATNTSDGNERLKVFSDDLQMLTSTKSSTEVMARNYISNQVKMLKPDVSSILQRCDDQIELDSELQRLLTPLYTDVENWLANKLGDINGQLSADVTYHFEKENHDNSNAAFDSIITQARQVIGDETNIKDLLLLGRKFKIPGLKGRWEKTLGKWAGKGAIAVQVVSFLWDTYRAHDEQEKQNQAQRQQAVELYQAVDQICGTVVQELSTSVTEIVDTVLSAQISSLNSKISVLSEEMDLMGRDKQLIKQHILELDSVTI
ncbi:GTPase [Vibrio sp. Vb1018]|uniref:GTPase n=1 Tax=Vibrio sp. Vb1018 TaxID=3074636 RepID=UPI002964B954|nr:GTPase [Vibrio sp. Vb1018]MDW1821576.1 GTPase [Vibrio sp. Vb1018]